MKRKHRKTRNEIREFPHLSRSQQIELGTLLSVMFNEDTPDNFLRGVMNSGLVEITTDGRPVVTEKGLNEKNRLCTLRGLNIRYRSEER